MAAQRVMLRGKRDWLEFYDALRLYASDCWKYWDPTVEAERLPPVPADPGDDIDAFVAGEVERGIKNKSKDPGPAIQAMLVKNALAKYDMLARKHERYQAANTRICLYIQDHVRPHISRLLADKPPDGRVRIAFLYRYFRSDPDEDMAAAGVAYHEAVARFDAENLDRSLDEWSAAVCDAGRVGHRAVLRADFVRDLCNLVDEFVPSYHSVIWGKYFGTDNDEDPLDVTKWVSMVREHVLDQRDKAAEKRPYPWLEYEESDDEDCADQSADSLAMDRGSNELAARNLDDSLPSAIVHPGNHGATTVLPPASSNPASKFAVPFKEDDKTSSTAPSPSNPSIVYPGSHGAITLLPSKPPPTGPSATTKRARTATMESAQQPAQKRKPSADGWIKRPIVVEGEHFTRSPNGPVCTACASIGHDMTICFGVFPERASDKFAPRYLHALQARVARKKKEDASVRVSIEKLRAVRA